MPITVIASLLKIVAVIGYIMLAVPMIVWLERKVIADCQARVGPERVGPFGLLQSFVDGIKLVLKESLIPRDVDHLLYMAAPVIVMIPALSVAAVVPFGGDLKIGQTTIRMVIADLPVGFLFVLALTSLSVYGIVLSGWASNNKYSLLGGLRSAAQMVSYELPMGLAVIAGLLIAGHNQQHSIFTLKLSQIVDAQSGPFWNWTAFNYHFGFLGLVAMIAFYIGGLAETNRAPFDLPEAETELIGGYHTEYGGLRWAMFFLGEYAAMLNVAAITTTLFLGGWRAPYGSIFPPGSIAGCIEGIVWFGIKVYAIITIYIWIRATLPRLRYDRLMAFSWKVMLPGTLALVLVIATILTAFYGTSAPKELLTSSAAGPGAASEPPMPGAFPPGGFPGGRPRSPLDPNRLQEQIREKMREAGKMPGGGLANIPGLGPGFGGNGSVPAINSPTPSAPGIPIPSGSPANPAGNSPLPH